MSNYGLTKFTVDDAIELLNDDVKAFKVEISEYVIDHIYLDSDIRNLLKSLYWQLNGLENDVQGIKDILAEQKESE